MEYTYLDTGDRVTFLAYNYLSGEFYDENGVIVGRGNEVRKHFPEEAGDAPDSVYLIEVKDKFGNTNYHIVEPNEIIGLKDHDEREE